MNKWIKDILFLLAAIYLMAGWGCAERFETAAVMNDSTIVFPQKDPDGISAKVTFCSKVSRKTGKRTGTNHIFALSENADVFAVVDLRNCDFNNQNSLLFHVDWIDPNGNSFFQKRIDLTPADSSTVLHSSISLNPDKREPGRYLFRVYLFRELIAEKYFTLLPYGQKPPSAADLLNVDVELSNSNADLETGSILNDSVFTIDGRGNVYANARVDNMVVLLDDMLEFTLSWHGPTGETWFKKEFEFTPADSSAVLSSAISLDPDKREPGPCSVRLYLFDELLAEEKFTLISAPMPKLPKLSRLNTTMTFCKKFNSKTGEMEEIDSVFSIQQEGWIHAVVKMNNADFEEKHNLKFEIEWIDPSGKSFYRKQIDVKTGKNEMVISAAISVSIAKRSTGVYKVKLNYAGRQLKESTFRLTE